MDKNEKSVHCKCCKRKFKGLLQHGLLVDSENIVIRPLEVLEEWEFVNPNYYIRKGSKAFNVRSGHDEIVYELFKLKAKNQTHAKLEALKYIKYPYGEQDDMDTIKRKLLESINA